MASALPVLILASGTAFVMPRNASIAAFAAEVDGGNVGLLKRNGLELLHLSGGTNDLSWCLSGLNIVLLEGDTLASSGGLTIHLFFS